MFNKTSSLMLQTIMVLLDKQTATMDPAFPTSAEPVEVERCYAPYGCFSVAHPWVTDTRPVNNFPEPPEKVNVRFAVLTRRNMRIPLILQPEDAEAVRISNIDPRGPFYLLSHGYMDSGEKPWVEKLTQALLSQKDHASATVIVVDWRHGANTAYTQAVANIRLVGVIAAHMVHLIYKELGLRDLNNFHYIGHSLGAHLGGYCGHTLQKKFGLKLGRITGMDPAEPHFARTDTRVRLDRSDADYVDVIHTDTTPFTSGGLGILEPIGHVDVYPNGGHDQPGCEHGVVTSIQSEAGSIWRGFQRFLSCNHVKSYVFLTESIAPSCPFYSIQCESYESFLAGNCTRCDRHHLCIPLGFHSYPVYRRLLAAGFVSKDRSLVTYSMTGDGSNASPHCRIHYKVTFKISEPAQSTVETEVGRLFIAFVDVEGNQSNFVPIDGVDGKYHQPGSVTTVMVPATSTGARPAAAVVEWKYEMSVLNVLSWRLWTTPRIFIDWIHVSSLEFNVEFKVCPKQNEPIIANTPHHLNETNCAA